MNNPAGYIPSTPVLDKAVKKLMKMGLVKMVRGDDGDFYYDLTEKGKKMGVILSDQYIPR
jgi:predicted transcriptional regulator with HTH domain